MRNAAEQALESPLPIPPGRTLVALPLDDGATERAARELLIRRLAADRLRELRDDGVTPAYVARMYGVDPAEIEELRAELRTR